MTRRLVIVNSSWLVADKVIRLGLGLLVWLWIARNVGPEAFGKWNFAIAFAAVFAAIAGLGLDGIVQRELMATPSETEQILGTAAALRLLAGLLAALVCFGAVIHVRPSDPLIAALVALNALSFVLQSSQVIDYYFQARMKSRPAVVAVNAAFLAATLVRLLLLWQDAPLLWFGATLVLEATCAALLLLWATSKDGMPAARWRVSLGMARRLMSASWPLLLSSIAVMVYMRIDQIMLGSLLGDVAVGQFSAALRISEVWYFVPTSIMIAAFPVMMNKRREDATAYEAYVQRLYDGMAWLGLAVAIVVTLGAPWAVPRLYGAAYAPAAEILVVQTWAGVTVAMSFVHGKWLLAEGLQRYGLFYTVVGACVNVSLNLIFIPKLGAIGAAWSTLATQVGLLPLQLVFPKARRNFLLMLRTLAAPFRVWRWLGLAGARHSNS